MQLTLAKQLNISRMIVYHSLQGSLGQCVNFYLTQSSANVAFFCVQECQVLL